MELIAPVMEGFSDPTMNNVFQDLLRVSKTNNIKKTKGSNKKSKNSCPAPVSQALLTQTQATSETTSTGFLKDMLLKQKATADSLMKTAKKIGPAAQAIQQKEDAYDAAFENDTPAGIPSTQSTLQGFTLVFFILSYIALAGMSALAVSVITSSPRKVIYTLIGYVILGIVLFSIILRLG